MEVHTFFLQLMVILLLARILAELAVRFKMPSVIGELLAGVVLGPSLLGWLQPTEVLKLLAEIGVILLLFEVGMETDVGRLMRAGPKALLVAVAGFILPFVLGAGLCRGLFQLPLVVSLFVGGTLTATSIGITVRVLCDLRREQSLEGQIVLGAAVIDDVLGVVLLALLYEFSTGVGVSLVSTGKVMLFVGAFFLFAPMAAKLMSQVISHFDAKSEIPGMIPTTVVSLVLFFAWLAHVVGAPELLGGFAAGLALSRRFFLPFGIAIRTSAWFSDRLSSEMRPIVRLFTPIFFVMVGVSLDLRSIDWGSAFIWAFSLSLLLVAVIGKVAAGLLVQEAWPVRSAIGIAMVPRGEVGIIFAELGRMSGILANDSYAGLVLVIACTTLLAPFALKGFYGHYGQRLSTNSVTAPTPRQDDVSTRQQAET
ncbi:MAG: cation:proton antiporter [Gammaproteobacteria bacterium]|jgi:Kef-type K+ transport system membrane component KefB